MQLYHFNLSSFLYTGPILRDIWLYASIFWSTESCALHSTHSGPSSRHPCGFQAHFWEGHGDPSPKNNSSLGVPGMTWNQGWGSWWGLIAYFSLAGVEALHLRQKPWCSGWAHSQEMFKQINLPPWFSSVPSEESWKDGNTHQLTQQTLCKWVRGKCSGPQRWRGEPQFHPNIFFFQVNHDYIYFKILRFWVS